MRQKLVTLAAFSFLFAAVLYSCNNSNSKQADKTAPEKTETDYLAIGKKMAAETQAVLAKNLVNAINTGGAENALEFCNINAMLLTDSMAQLLNARIKRVTDKTRNTANQANEMELAYINTVRNRLKTGGQTDANLLEIDGKMVGYYPIVTNQMCLQCHGSSDVDIEKKTFQKINTLYPHDKAIGYKVNELRGLWVVEMNR